MEQKRNAPIIADLKDIQEQEKVVQREQKEENEAMVERAQARVRLPLQAEIDFIRKRVSDSGNR